MHWSIKIRFPKDQDVVKFQKRRKAARDEQLFLHHKQCTFQNTDFLSTEYGKERDLGSTWSSTRWQGRAGEAPGCGGQLPHTLTSTMVTFFLTFSGIKEKTSG
jgi:hypothetical protein